MSNFLCIILSIFCNVTSPNTSYNDKQRIVLPVESFGIANWRIQYFRKGIRAPADINKAMNRAMIEVQKWNNNFPDMKVVISIAPRTYILKESIFLNSKSHFTIMGTGGMLNGKNVDVMFKFQGI